MMSAMCWQGRRRMRTTERRSRIIEEWMDWRWNQKKLAKEAGFKPSTLSRKMRGTLKWSADDIRAIAYALKLNQQQVYDLIMLDFKEQEERQ